MSELIPLIEMSDTEQHVIAEVLSQPVVKKYFRMLGSNLVKELITVVPADNESDADYIRKEAIHKGQIALLETLLSIQKPQE